MQEMSKIAFYAIAIARFEIAISRCPVLFMLHRTNIVRRENPVRQEHIMKYFESAASALFAIAAQALAIGVVVAL